MRPPSAVRRAHSSMRSISAGDIFESSSPFSFGFCAFLVVAAYTGFSGGLVSTAFGGSTGSTLRASTFGCMVGFDHGW